MEKLALTNRVFDIKRASTEVHIHACNLTVLCESGVSATKVMPEGIKTAKIVGFIAGRIDDVLEIIESEAAKLNQDVTEKVAKFNRNEIRLIA